MSLDGLLCRVVNDAYAVETGDSGYGFKAGLRMVDPLDDYFLKGYQEGRILKVVSKPGPGGEIIGVTYWRITDGGNLYFGPFAVRPDMQGRKVGKLMLQEVERIAREKNLAGIEIKVVNWRTDLIPWYEEMGYQHTEAMPWPEELDHVLLRKPTYFLCMVRPLPPMEAGCEVVQEVKLGSPAASNNAVKFTGGCLCGKVRYTVQSLPHYVYYCHCSKCRRISGSVVAAWLTVAKSDLSLVGDLSTFCSSKHFCRQFCTSCGSHILFMNAGTDVNFVELCHGSLDEQQRFPPQNHIWCSSKLDYLSLNDELPTFETEPYFERHGM